MTADIYQQSNGLYVAQQTPAAFAQPLAQPGRKQQGISVMVHGWQKQGKSSFGDTGPRPTLALDVETASFWTPSLKVYWNPQRETVPTWPMDPRAAGPGNPEGLWDTCVVTIHDYQQLFDLLQILNRGQHPFNSISMDSVTEIQQRVIFSLAGTRQMEQKHWGQLLRNVNALIRGYRDLITHPTRPVWSVCYICGTHWDMKTSKYRPLVQGQSQDYLPYVPDLLGWLYAAEDGSRQLWTGPSTSHETGERLWGRLPYGMQLGYPGKVPGWTLESMVSQVLASR